jgi:hypothetical protein
MVDIKNTELYLKVISQIHNVYKTEGARMLFSGGVGGSSHQQQQQCAPGQSNGQGRVGGGRT